MLYQVSPARRALFAETVRALDGHWIAIESPETLIHDSLLPLPDGALHNVLALDGRPLAWTRGRGPALSWFG